MGNLSFVVAYLQSCLGGKLAVSDCSSAWQMLIIAVLLVLAVVTLVVIRLRSRDETSNA